MSGSPLKLCIPGPGQRWSEAQLDAVSPCLERMDAESRIAWALDFLPARPVLSSSFGAQAAVMLHMVTRQMPDIPVLLIDTGYLFSETYRFIDELTEKLDLKLKVIHPGISPAWQEARLGKLWKQGAEGIRRYNQLNKVKPMEEALREFEAGTWFSGLRRVQSDSRKNVGIVQAHGPVVKVHPIADWSNRDVHRYLKGNKLPYHPLWEQGYVSIGDRHTSRPLSAGMREEDTRFFGLVRECGLHEADNFGRTGS